MTVDGEVHWLVPLVLNVMVRVMCGEDIAPEDVEDIAKDAVAVWTGDPDVEVELKNVFVHPDGVVREARR